MGARTFAAQARYALCDDGVFLRAPLLLAHLWGQVVVPPLSALLPRPRGVLSHVPGQISPPPDAELSDETLEALVFVFAPGLPHHRRTPRLARILRVTVTFTFILIFTRPLTLQCWGLVVDQCQHQQRSGCLLHLHT